jgi:hypothetical protein
MKRNEPPQIAPRRRSSTGVRQAAARSAAGSGVEFIVVDILLRIFLKGP